MIYMPHWVKKFRNALTNKSRDLKFRHRYMKLKQVEKIWRDMESIAELLLCGNITFTMITLN